MTVVTCCSSLTVMKTSAWHATSKVNSRAKVVSTVLAGFITLTPNGVLCLILSVACDDSDMDQRASNRHFRMRLHHRHNRATV